MKLNKAAIFISCVLILITVYFVGLDKREKTYRDGVYTIFFIENVIRGKGLPQVTFSYYYSGQKFNGTYTCDSNALNEMNGKRFFGKIIPYTDTYYTCCYCEVPTGIIDVPKKGWKTLPQKYCSKTQKYCF